MIRRLVACLVVLAALCPASGCGDPCQELAARTCKRVGRTDPLCARLQSIAAAPQAGDEQACRAGNTFVDELRRNR